MKVGVFPALRSKQMQSINKKIFIWFYSFDLLLSALIKLHVVVSSLQY